MITHAPKHRSTTILFSYTSTKGYRVPLVILHCFLQLCDHFFLLQNIKIQKKIETEAETEKKQLKGKINKLNDVASISKHSQSLKDERIQDLNNQLTKAKADTDLMFKVTLNAHHFNLVHNDCIKLLIPETMLYLV